MKLHHCIFAASMIFGLPQWNQAQEAFPPERRGSWELAGFSETSREIPRQFDRILDIRQHFGAIGNGIVDDRIALDSAIQYHRGLTGSGTTLIQFPPGIYRLSSPIVLNSSYDNGLAFRGSGATSTTLRFICNASTGHLIELQNTDSVGIENLRIEREGSANDLSSNIFIGNSSSCWITGVESVNPMQYHVWIANCLNIVVKGCFFHEASHYGVCFYPLSFLFPDNKHTHGYGVVLGSSSSHCLVEDNIFRFLRHGIGFSDNANNNVAIFNYVREGHAIGSFLIGTQPYKDMDIFCHGQGSSANLVEQNVVDILGVDDHISQVGPKNTFFRNRVLYDASSFWEPDEYCDEDNRFVSAPYLNLLGNMFTNDGDEFFNPEFEPFPGFDFLQTRFDIFVTNGTNAISHSADPFDLQYGFAVGYLPIASILYSELPTAPDFETLPGSPWPLIGPRLNLESPFLPQFNAAYYRWGDTKKTVDAKPVTQFQVSVRVENIFPGSSASGSLTVNGNSYQLPVSAFVLPGGSTIQLTAPVQYHSSVSYSPSHWTNNFLPNESFTGANISVPLVRDVTFTAHYVPIPDPPPNIQPLGDVGEQPHLIWQEHPNPNVLKYQIWRVIKPYNQNALPATQIAELNRGTTQFTDEEFVVTSGRTNDLVSYDVRAVLVVSGNSYYSTPCWYTYFARGGAVPNIVGPHTDPFAVGQITEETLTSLELNAYPNPFNPSTCVNFSISAPSYISLILFDMLGREVTRLRDGMIAAGSYSNNLDASHLSAGVYFLRLTQLSEGKPPQSVARRIILSK